MKYVKIGTTSLNVSKVCMGTGNFGEKLSEAEAMNLLDLFSDRGGNFLDTANVYCRWITGNTNTAEQIIGKWLKKRKKTNQMVIASKGGHYDFSNPTFSRISRKEIRKDLEESLKTLGLEAIPLYYLHRDDMEIPMEEIMGWMEEFVKKGLIQYYAASNFTTNRMRQGDIVQRRHALQGFSALSNQWSYACRNLDQSSNMDPTMVWMQAEDLNWVMETQTPLLPYTSTAQGFFEKLDKGNLSEEMKQAYLNEENLKKYQILKEESRRTGRSLYQLSLQKIMEEPFNVIPVGSFRSEEQLLEFIKVGEL